MSSRDTIVAAADGTKLHVRSNGAAGARPLLFINAMGTTLSMWDRQAAAFPDRLVIRFDLRGTGASGPSASDWSTGRLAGDVVSILDHLGAGKADIVGSSLGGMVAMQLAATSPERVGAAVLANTTARLPNSSMWDERISQARREGLDNISRATIGRWVGEDLAREEPATVRQLEEDFAATPVDGYVGCCEVLRDSDMSPFLGAISAPTLVIAGWNDAASPLAASQFLRDSIPGAQLEVIPGSGHLSNIDQPRLFNEALASFLGTSAKTREKQS